MSEQDTTSSDEKAPETELRRLRKENTLLRDKMQEYAKVIENQDETIHRLRDSAHTQSSNESEEAPADQALGQKKREQEREYEQTAVATSTAGEDSSSESDTEGETESDTGGLLDRLRSLL